MKVTQSTSRSALPRIEYYLSLTLISWQDIAARFTLDSATEFLFGIDVHSLSTGIPYPYYSPQAEEAAAATATSPSSFNSSTRFAEAFSEAQLITLQRARFGLLWPLLEFWHDRMEEPRKIVHELIDPIVADAVATKRKVFSDSGKESVVDREKTLLEDLASSTDGKKMFQSISTKIGT